MTETPYTRARDHVRAFRLYSARQSTPYTRLRDLDLLEVTIDRIRAGIVHTLRAEGASWREVGEALRLTESQARHQYGGRDTA